MAAAPTGPQTLTLGKALNTGLRRALADDPKVVVLGEDVGVLGGVYRITDGLQPEFGAHRVVDTPLAESGIIGTAIGLAFRGYRPVAEIQFDGFVYPAFDQIVSQLARMHARTRGAVRDNRALNQAIASQTALGRVGLPDDIGPVVATLLGEGTGWINGQRVEASGGMFL